jgi:hypothetical protein
MRKKLGIRDLIACVLKHTNKKTISTQVTIFSLEQARQQQFSTIRVVKDVAHKHRKAR